ncbi:MAG: phytanoyl-CoA dioxygenase family protein [bacterium]|nr:phytanoyl-CoA dioxygenase family protein [bacterium]MDE0418673.1 phytanoyl-CoA dioxygenase family protein [bacterium]
MACELDALAGDAGVDDIVEAVDRDGAAIVADFVDAGWLDRFNREIDPAVEKARRYHFDNPAIDAFLGEHTVRLHGLLAKAPSFVELMIEPRLLAMMDHWLLPRCSSYLFSAGELIEIRGGETAQRFHVDDGSWPVWPRRGAGLLQMNVMVAATDFTRRNGATLVAPGSHRWESGRLPCEGEIARVVMPQGGIAIIRGDCLHAGGSNIDGTRRRAISLSWCLGWLRTVENSWLNLPLDVVAGLPRRARELLGYEIYDGSADEVRSGFLGYYEMGSPRVLFED